MKIAAFDLGRHAAVADNLDIGPDRIELWSFKGDRKQRAGLFMQSCRQYFIQTSSQLDVVFYERPFARGYDATRCLWGLAGILEACAEEAQIATVDMPPGSIKKYAAGKGAADKQAMIAMAQIMGYCGDNEHEADAFLALQYALVHCIKE